MLALLNQLAVSFDLPILDWIQAHLQCGFLDAVMPIVTLFGEGGIFWIAWAVLMLVFPKTRKTGIAMGIALVMGVLICNVTLKPLVARPRPYDFQYENFGITIKLLIDAQHDYSFPSGHIVVARRARQIAQEAEDAGEKLEVKPVTMAIQEVADGKLSVAASDIVITDVEG